MKVNSITIKNLKSFGNDPQTLEFGEGGNLILLSGRNGSGKCVDKNTNIDIEINDLNITDNLLSYLAETEVGNRVFKYIKENNNILYEKIRDQINKQ